MDKIKKTIFFHCRRDKQTPWHHDICLQTLFEWRAEIQEQQSWMVFCRRGTYSKRLPTRLCIHNKSYATNMNLSLLAHQYFTIWNIFHRKKCSCPISFFDLQFAALVFCSRLQETHLTSLFLLKSFRSSIFIF